MSALDGKGWRTQQAEEVDRAPLYARVLRLKHIRPGPWWCFLFLEGAVVLAGGLVLADVVSRWALVVLPLAVAVAVKLNDLVAGALPAAPDDS